MDSEMATVFGAFAVIMIVYLLILGIGIASYIMTSWGLYSIADRRQIANPWLAWLPIGNSWIIGSIADEYDGRNGLKRKWRLVLLILNLVSIFVFIASYIVFFVSAFAIAFQVGNDEPTFGQALGMILPFLIGLIITVSVAMAAQICMLVCMYKIFESTVPEKSVKYLLLSLLIPLASAICLMICRKKGYSKKGAFIAGVPEQLPDIIEREDIPFQDE